MLDGIQISFIKITTVMWCSSLQYISEKNIDIIQLFKCWLKHDRKMYNMYLYKLDHSFEIF